MNELPHDISSAVVSDFLEIKDLANLDIAVSNRASRPALLSLFARENVSSIGLRNATLHLDPYLAWMHSRNLRVREVTITEKQWIDLLHGLWYRNTEDLEKLTLVTGQFEQNGSLDHFRFPIASLVRFRHLKILHLHRLALAPLCAPLATCCPFLTNLELVSVQVSMADQEFLFARGPIKIHHLRLEDMNNFTLQASIFPVLRSLEIVSLPNAPTEIITFIQQQNSLLRQLTLQPDRSNASNFDFNSLHITRLLMAISKFQFEYLQLHEIAGLGDRAFVSAMHNTASSLEYLNLEHCNRISGETTAMLAERCKNLKSLNFCGTSVTDEGIIGLINCSPHLEYLDVSNCCELSDAVLVTLRGCVFRGLNIECCPKMSDDGLIRMIYRCPSLESLNIRGTGDRGNYHTPNAEMTSLVTGRSFQAIANHARNLTELIIGHNPFVTMTSLQNILQLCPRLMKLEVTRLRDPENGGGLFEQMPIAAAAANDQVDVDDMDMFMAMATMPPHLPMMPPHHPHHHQQQDLPHFMPDMNHRSEESLPLFRPSPNDAPRFLHIRKLKLKMVNIREEELMAMLQRCVNIRELRLLRVGRLTRRGIRHLLSVLPNLVLLDITGFTFAASLLDMKHIASSYGFAYDEPARIFRR